MKDSKISEENRRKWAEIIAKAWKDKQFKEKLFAQPNLVLKENGFDCHANINYKIVEARANERYLTLPPMPQEALSETEIKSLAASACSCKCGG